MDLFFLASKIGWLLLTPSNLLLLALLGGVLLLRWTRTRRIGVYAASAGAIATAVLIALPISEWLIRGIEQRFAPYQACAREDRPIAGIVLLGGAISSREVAGRIVEDLGGPADRIRYVVQLAKQYPDLPVIVSGGRSTPREGARTEAEATGDVLAEFGVPRERIILETKSRTTAENAEFTKRQTRAGAWLLVTSAFHMPRSVGSFRAAGVDVIAAPVDWIVDDNPHIFSFRPIDRIALFDLAIREYVGSFVYWISGRSSEVIPGPTKSDACPTTNLNAPAAS